MSSQTSLTKLINSIQNGQRSRLLSIVVPKSKINVACSKILQDTGFIRGYRLNRVYLDKFHMEVLLKYVKGKPVINNISQVSKPSRKVYVSMSFNKKSKFKKKMSLSLKKKDNFWIFEDIDKISQFMNGLFIFSTSKGLLTHNEAYRLSVGGEVLFKVF